MLLLFQGYYPQVPEPEVPPTPPYGGGYRVPEIRRKLYYLYRPEDIERLSEEEILALWAFTEIL
jgi:hypothetical protein